MCGRYSIFLPAAEIETRFDVSVTETHEPRYNAAPAQQLPVVTNHDPTTLTHHEWGFTPDWADSRIINTRSETVHETFSDAYERRRCLVLANGYFEWADTGAGKRPYYISRPDDEPFAMAGLWEPTPDDSTQTGLDAFGAGGESEPRPPQFSILTTEANEFQSQYHHRMPVVLAPDEERTWLADPSETLLSPYDGALTAHPVSSRVNSPANDDPSLVEPR